MGFAGATIPKIAERADVAPRTVSVWFPVKEDILFEDIGDQVARLEAELRGGEGTVVDRIDRWLVRGEPSGCNRTSRSMSCASARSWPTRSCAPASSSSSSRSAPRSRRAVAHDLQQPEGSMRPQVFAAAAMGFLLSIRTQNLAGSMTPAQREAGLAFLRAGLAAG